MKQSITTACLLLWLCGISHAAITFISGFETGDTNEWTVGGGGVVGTWTIGTTPVHGGAYSVSGTPVTTDHRLTGALSSSAATMYGRVYIQLTGLNANIAFGQFQIFNVSSSTNECQIYVITNGSSAPSLAVGNAAVSALGSPTQVGSPSSVSISASTWVELGLQMVANASTGQCNLQVNNANAITATGLNTGSANVGFVQPVAYNAIATGSPAGTVYFDDILVSTSGYPAPGATITRQCNTVTPTFNTWAFSTGSNIYNVWDDTPVDNHYAFSSGSSAKQTCPLSFGNTTATGATGHGSGVITASSKINGADVVWLGNSAVSGDTAQDSSIWYPGGSEIDTVGPSAYPGNTASIWEATIITTPTAAQVLSLEAGTLHAANTFRHNVFGTWTMIDYSASSVTGGTGQGVFMP